MNNNYKTESYATTTLFLNYKMILLLPAKLCFSILFVGFFENFHFLDVYISRESGLRKDVVEDYEKNTL